MLFKSVLTEARVVLNEMTVNGLISILTKDTSKVDKVVLPNILNKIGAEPGYSIGLFQNDGVTEIDATAAYSQIVAALKGSPINISANGMLVQVINKLASTNKTQNAPVRVAGLQPAGQDHPAWQNQPQTQQQRPMQQQG